MKLTPVLALLLVVSCAKPAAPPLEEVRPGFEAWQRARSAYTDAFRESGLRSGKNLPPALAALREEAEAARRSFLDAWGSRDPLPPEAWRWVALAREGGRDYAGACDAFEKALVLAPEADWWHEALARISMAALNAKDPERAARWMKYLLDFERNVPEAERRGGGIRRVYYPRVLADLGRFGDLLAHADALGEGGDAAKARFLALMGLGRTGEAEAIADRLSGAVATDPGLAGWGVAAMLAFHASRREYEAAEGLLDRFVAEVGAAKLPHPARSLLVVAEFLGEPAAPVRVDHWVGVDPAPSGDPLAAFPGRVLVLDFWQPWCEPCRKAMPKLVALKARLEGIEVLGLCRVEDSFFDPATREVRKAVSPADYPALVRGFRETMGLTYPLGIAEGRGNAEAWKIAAIPTIVVIDGEGIVRYMSVGAGERGLLELAVAGIAGG